MNSNLLRIFQGSQTQEDPIPFISIGCPLYEPKYFPASSLHILFIYLFIFLETYQNYEF